MERLVLWDIDGTLLYSGGVGAEVFDIAVERVMGIRPNGRPRMSGKTDPQIVREYLLALAVLEDEVDRYADPILGHLMSELAASQATMRAIGRTMPGVRAILRELAADEQVLQTVLTGNLAANASVKLAAFELEGLVDLEVGAFGSDSADRRELVPVTLERVERLRGKRFPTEAVWIVGDSANDLACARANGVRCLLVGTGGKSAEELDELGADAVIADLSDVERVLALLRS